MKGHNWVLITGSADRMIKVIPSNAIDFILTSPPYDNVRNYNGFNFTRRVFRKFAKEAYRVLKPGGIMVWVVGDQTIGGQETGTSFEQALYFRNEAGFLLYDTMIYRRSNPPLTHRRYEQGFEYMFVLTKGTPKTFNGIREPKLYPETKPRKKAWHRFADGSFKKGIINLDDTKLHDNVWHYGKGVTSHKIAHEHPAIFPEALALDQIFSWSNPGDVVLDPFCGSGTTAAIALELKRRFIGIDISPEYVALAQKRITLHTAKESVNV